MTNKYDGVILPEDVMMMASVTHTIHSYGLEILYKLGDPPMNDLLNKGSD